MQPFYSLLGLTIFSLPILTPLPVWWNICKRSGQHLNFIFHLFGSIFLCRIYPTTQLRGFLSLDFLCYTLLFHGCTRVFTSLPIADIQFILLPLKTFLPFRLSLSFPSAFLSTPCISLPPSPCLSLCDMCFHHLAQGEVFRLTADHLLINSFHLAADSQSSLFIRTSLTKSPKQTHTIIYNFHLVGRLKPTWWFIYNSKHVLHWWLQGGRFLFFFLTRAQANKLRCNLENPRTVHGCDVYVFVQSQLIWSINWHYLI